MNGEKTSERTILLLILGAELLVFSGSFDKFFNHDSLFYLVHSPRSWADFLAILTSPDATQQYRPLTLGAMALVVPFFGLDHRLYHLIPLAFHMFNTVLLYMLARRLMPFPPAAVVATGLWALHSVSGWVTYGITYISDLMLATFVLSSLILAVDGRRSGSLWRASGAVLLCMAALLTKEVAVAFPVALLVTLVLDSLREEKGENNAANLMRAVRRALPITAVCLLICLAYSGLVLFWLQTGKMYPQSTSSPYAIDPFSNLLGKAKYLFWSLNLPDPLHVQHPNRTRAIAFLLSAVPLVLWAIDIAKRRGKLMPLEWGGVAWLVGMSLPVLTLSDRVAKWYLYVPIIGLALALGAAAGRARVALPRLQARVAVPAVAAVFLLPTLYSSAAQTRSFLRSSDSSYASTVVESCLRDLQKARPDLPSAVTLYVLPTFEKNVSEFFAGGKLYEMFYPGTRVRMLFADRGDPLPEDFHVRTDFLVLRYLYGHVYDVTGHYKGRRLRQGTRPLITDLKDVRASVSRSEFYYDYERFDTPGGTPVFFPAPDHEIFSQIGGSTAVVPVGPVPAGASLHAEASWMHDQGDGGWAELRIRSGAEETVHYRRYFKPNARGEGLSWEDVRVDLKEYEGKNVELILRCYNDPGKTTVADWLNWRRIVLDTGAAPRLEEKDSDRPGSGGS